MICGRLHPCANARQRAIAICILTLTKSCSVYDPTFRIAALSERQHLVEKKHDISCKQLQCQGQENKQRQCQFQAGVNVRRT